MADRYAKIALAALAAFLILTIPAMAQLPICQAKTCSEAFQVVWDPAVKPPECRAGSAPRIVSGGGKNACKAGTSSESPASGTD
jgi:hypothetical protein